MFLRPPTSTRTDTLFPSTTLFRSTSARLAARWSCSPVTAQSFPTIFIAVLLCLFAGTAEARPAVIYSVGGKFDGSFNEAAWVGAERYREETDESYGAFEIASPAQSLQALQRSEERRVGKECGSPCRSRGPTYH